MNITAQKTSDPRGTVVQFHYHDLQSAGTLGIVGSSALVRQGHVLVTPINLRLIELALTRAGHTLKLKDKVYKKQQDFWAAPHYCPGWRPNEQTRHGDLIRLQEPVTFQSGRSVQLAEIWQDRHGQFPVLYGIDRSSHLSWKTDFWQDYPFDIVRRYPENAEFFDNPTRNDGIMMIRVIVMQQDGGESIPSEQDAANHVQRYLNTQSGPVAVHFNRNGTAVAWPMTGVPDMATITAFAGPQADFTPRQGGVMFTSRQPTDDLQHPCNETLGYFGALLNEAEGKPAQNDAPSSAYTHRPGIQKSGEALYLHNIVQSGSELTVLPQAVMAQ